MRGLNSLILTSPDAQVSMMVPVTQSHQLNLCRHSYTPIAMPEDSRLGEIVPNPNVEKILNGFQFTEGPLWASGRLLFSDIPASTIYSWTPGAKHAAVHRRPSGRSNGLTLDRRGCLIACEHDRRLTRTEQDGSLKVLAESYDGRRLNSPNDVVVARNGSIYFTDPPYGLNDEMEGKELPYQGVYRLGVRGKLTLLDDTFERPNGLAFSPDESKLYVDDTARRHIRVFDVQGRRIYKQRQGLRGAYRR